MTQLFQLNEGFKQPEVYMTAPPRDSTCICGVAVCVTVCACSASSCVERASLSGCVVMCIHPHSALTLKCSVTFDISLSCSGPPFLPQQNKRSRWILKFPPLPLPTLLLVPPSGPFSPFAAEQLSQHLKPQPRRFPDSRDLPFDSQFLLKPFSYRSSSQ